MQEQFEYEEIILVLKMLHVSYKDFSCCKTIVDSMNACQ